MERLSAGIYSKVGTRLSDLEVRQVDYKVVVRGRADSFYAWQLAIAACQQVLLERSDLLLDCKLDVLPT